MNYRNCESNQFIETRKLESYFSQSKNNFASSILRENEFAKWAINSSTLAALDCCYLLFIDKRERRVAQSRKKRLWRSNMEIWEEHLISFNWNEQSRVVSTLWNWSTSSTGECATDTRRWSSISSQDFQTSQPSDTYSKIDTRRKPQNICKFSHEINIIVLIYRITAWLIC